MHFCDSHMFQSRAGVNRSSLIQVCWKLKITFSLDAGPRPPAVTQKGHTFQYVDLQK